jgi:hypothetical protein
MQLLRSWLAMPSFITIRFNTIQRKVFGAALTLAASAMLSGCGGHAASITAPPIPNEAGSWEFVAISNNGPVTGIEVALKEGQVLVGQVEQPDGQISASSTQIAFVSINPNSLNPINVTGFGGACGPISSVNSLGPGSVTAPNGAMNFTFTENGTVFNVYGALSGDGQSFLNGTYTESGNSCSADTGGTITGAIVPKLSGTYVGPMCPLADASCQSSQDFTDTATASLSESSSGVLTVSLGVTGTDNANFTLSGPVTGNAFSVQGTYQGQLLTYYGYFEVHSNVQSLYLVNATNPVQPAYAGTLAVPPQT